MSASFGDILTMAIDGRKIYEVYNRQTGGLLARGSVAECARELGITPSGFRAAIRSQRKYVIRHVETVRKIYSVYDDHAGLISQGSLHKVAEEMGYSESTVERWGRIGNAPGMTVMVTEKLELESKV